MYFWSQESAQVERVTRKSEWYVQSKRTVSFCSMENIMFPAPLNWPWWMLLGEDLLESSFMIFCVFLFIFIQTTTS